MVGWTRERSGSGRGAFNVASCRLCIHLSVDLSTPLRSTPLHSTAHVTHSSTHSLPRSVAGPHHPRSVSSPVSLFLQQPCTATCYTARSVQWAQLGSSMDSVRQ